MHAHNVNMLANNLDQWINGVPKESDGGFKNVEREHVKLDHPLKLPSRLASVTKGHESLWMSLGVTGVWSVIRLQGLPPHYFIGAARKLNLEIAVNMRKAAAGQVSR
eukprot:SAG11_NODE_11111_length_783_cov_0.615497_1_plen_106_part_10